MGADLEIVIKGKDAGASKALSDLGEQMGKLKDKSISLTTRGLNGLRDVMMNGLKTAAIGAGAALGGLAAGIGSSVKAAMDMEQQLADISASMGTTAEETADLKKLITDLGLDPKLKVSATEAADAIQTLGTAGVSTTDILGGAAKATVLLANATGADFGDAAAIASDAMALWKIEAKDLTGVVNGVTSTTIASKFGINDYRLALAAAGGVAATVGVEFDDFNAVIAAISPSFSSGSDAGTSFKTFLQRLVPASDTAWSAMQELGIITNDYAGASDFLAKQLGRSVEPNMNSVAAAVVELGEKTGDTKLTYGDFIKGFQQNQFFDETTGQLKSMSEVSGILSGAMANLTEEQKIQTLSTVFGTDAMRAAAAMAGIGNQKFLELKATMAKTDAEQQAATRMATFKGALEILSGTFETLKLQIGDKFLPVLTSMANKFNEFIIGNAPKIIAWAGTLATNLQALANWVLAVAEDGDIMNDWLTHMHPTLASVVLQVAEFVKWVKEVVIPLAQWTGETLGLKGVLLVLAGLFVASFIPTIISVISTIVTVVGAVSSFIGVLGAAMPVLAGVVAAALPVIGIVAAVGAALVALYFAWQNNWFGIRDITWQAVEYIKNLFVNLPATLSALGSQMWAVGRSIVTAIGDGISNAASYATSAMTTVINFVTGESQGRLSALAGTLYESGRTVINRVGEGFAAAKEFVNQQMSQVMNDIQERGVAFAAGALFGRMYEAGREALGRMGEGIRATSPNLIGDMQGALNGIINLFNSMMDGFKTHVYGVASAIGGSIAAGLRAVSPVGSIGEIVDGMVNRFNQTMEGFKTHARGMGGAVVSFLADGIKSVDPSGALSTSISTMIGKFNQTMDGFKTHVYSVASEVGGKIGEGLRSFNVGVIMSDSLQGIIDAFNQVMDGFKVHVWGVMKDIGSRIGNGLAEGVRNTIGAVNDALRWITDAAPQWIKDQLGIRSPSRVFMEIGNNIMSGLAQGIEQLTNQPQLALAGATDGLLGGGAQTTINNSRTTQTTNNFTLAGGAGNGGDSFETVRILNTLYGQA